MWFMKVVGVSTSDVGAEAIARLAASQSTCATPVSPVGTWSAEPKQEERKAFGLGAMIYLFILTVVVYFSYRRIWRNVAH